MNTKIALTLTGLNFALAIGFGAIGAHALKSRVTAKALETYLTGNRYHFYISISFILFILTEQVFAKMKLKSAYYFLIFALLSFVLGCYLYTITGITSFAHIVPFGGFAFIIAWILFATKAMRLNTI